MESVVVSGGTDGDDWIVKIPRVHWSLFEDFAAESRLPARLHGRREPVPWASFPASWRESELREVLSLCFDGGPAVTFEAEGAL